MKQLNKQIEEVKPEEVIYLHITSFNGISVGAEHYYGSLKSYNCEEIVELNRRITEIAEIRYLNKKVGYSNSYKIGDKTTGFTTEEQIKKEARKQYKKHFSNAKVIVLGDLAYFQPQPILLGPRNFKKIINNIYKKFNDLGQFDNPENDEEVEQLCKEWEKIWPKKTVKIKK